jgi:hypothetical protein
VQYSSTTALAESAVGEGGFAGPTMTVIVIEFADQLYRPTECMDATVAMVADVHHPLTAWTSTVEDVEFQKGEIGVRRPIVGHPADLHVLVRSVDGESATRGYAKKHSVSSPLSGH